ncbi:wax ester/triacylglycerol synthase domain-containing protein [Herbidospora sp. RD11066]
MSHVIPADVYDRLLLLEADRSADETHWYIGAAARLPGPPPRREDLYALLADGAARIPALAYRPSGNLRWEHDPGFDPARHVTFVDLPPGTDLNEALLAANAEKLPRDRPLWNLLVLSGHRPGEHVICYRAHHAFQDGAAVADAVGALLTGGTLPVPEPQARPERGPWWPPIRNLLRLCAPNPRWSAGGGTGPLMVTATLDLELYRTVTRATGATTAQISLAALAGALREWCAPRRDITVALPVLETGGPARSSVRSGLGNRAFLLAVKLPCTDPHPRRRLWKVMTQTGYARLAEVRHRSPVAVAILRSLLAARIPPTALGSGNRFDVTTPLGGPPPEGALEVLSLPPLGRASRGVAAFTQYPDRVDVTCRFAVREARNAALPGLLERGLHDLAALPAIRDALIVRGG